LYGVAWCGVWEVELTNTRELQTQKTVKYQLN
jgi:hypothetical protein